jgi:hypothetical protein
MNKSIINFKWETNESFEFPKDSQFYCTGHNCKEGIAKCFSIVVRLIDFDGEIESSTKAEVFALAEDMEYRLPKKGEPFCLTSGPKVVARGVSISRNF